MNKTLLTLLSLFISIIFGVIHSTSIFICEIPIKDLISKYLSIDEMTGELIASGVSTAISVFIGANILLLIKRKFELIESPYIDAGGILIGILLFACVYYVANQLNINININININTNININININTNIKETASDIAETARILPI